MKILNTLKGLLKLGNISSYTILSSDDLWTILSYNIELPNTSFDLVKIDLSGFEEDSDDWRHCIEDICNIVIEVPHIIILDRDLEIEQICEG